VKTWPNKLLEPTAVGACRSAFAVPAASRRRLSFFRCVAYAYTQAASSPKSDVPPPISPGRYCPHPRLGARGPAMRPKMWQVARGNPCRHHHQTHRRTPPNRKRSEPISKVLKGRKIIARGKRGASAAPGTPPQNNSPFPPPGRRGLPRSTWLGSGGPQLPLQIQLTERLWWFNIRTVRIISGSGCFNVHG
jgi:hypothetical protein